MTKFTLVFSNDAKLCFSIPNSLSQAFRDAITKQQTVYFGDQDLYVNLSQVIYVTVKETELSYDFD